MTVRTASRLFLALGLMASPDPSVAFQGSAQSSVRANFPTEALSSALVEFHAPLNPPIAAEVIRSQGRPVSHAEYADSFLPLLSGLYSENGFSFPEEASVYEAPVKNLSDAHLSYEESELWARLIERFDNVFRGRGWSYKTIPDSRQQVGRAYLRRSRHIGQLLARRVRSHNDRP